MKKTNRIASSNEVNILDHQKMAVATACDIAFSLGGDLLNEAAKHVFQKTLPRPTELQTVTEYEEFKQRAGKEFERGLKLREERAIAIANLLAQVSTNTQRALATLSGIEFTVSAAAGPDQYDQLATVLGICLADLRISIQDAVSSITAATHRG